MVAVVQAPPAQDRRLVVVRTTPAVRPAVRVPAATYRRRRAAAAALATTLLVALFIAVQVIAGSLGRAPLPAPQRSLSAGTVYVVQPGDTFWDIARALRPHDDPRPLVARLLAAHGSGVLAVGERITLPAGA